MGFVGGPDPRLHWLCRIHMGPWSPPPQKRSYGESIGPKSDVVDLFSLGVGQWILQRLPEKGTPSKTGVAGRKGGPMGRRALGGTVLHLPLPLHGKPTTCSKCDPSSLATLSRGPARLGCPHASPKPGQEPKQTSKRQHPASNLRPQGPTPVTPSLAFDQKEKRAEEKFPQRPPGPRPPGP